MSAPNASRSPRATAWQLASRRLEFAPLPLLMGIVNVTPDSFSDGGRYWQVDAAIEHGCRLVAEGAELLDIGGESTRPFATPVDAEVELERVIPVIRGLVRTVQVPISVDTSKAIVAEQAIAEGAEIVNDVTALRGDPRMSEVCRASGVGVCLMHMQGTPETMQVAPQYHQVVEDVLEELLTRRGELIEAGIASDRLCLDPGIGFGKTKAHNLALLSAARQFVDTGAPILIGASRKGFISKVAQSDTAESLLGGNLGVVLAMAAQGVQVVRVHEIAPVKAALALFTASGGMEKTADS